MGKIPQQWTKSIQKLPLESKGIIFLLGGSDTGKTNFCRLLVNCLVGRGLKVAVVDADVGQSTLGPPTTIGFASFKRSIEEFGHITASGMYFVGDNSPRGHLLEVVVGTRRMIDKAHDAGCQTIVVDSSGLVSYPYGVVLKYRKIELIQPDFIFAFQRENELNHIIEAISEIKKSKLIKVPVPAVVTKVSPEVRRLRRQEGYVSYFADATSKELGVDNLSVFPSKSLLSNEIDGLIVGLKDGRGEILGIGIITEIDSKKGTLKVLTPVLGAESVTNVVLGRLKLDSSFREAGRI